MPPALLLALLLAAGPADRIVHTGRPHYHALMPARAAAPLLRGAGVAPSCSDAQGRTVACNPATMLQVQYFGGRVIPNAKVQAVFWTAGVSATTQAQVGGFYEALTNSEWMDWLDEYSTVLPGGSGQRIGRGAFAGAWTITPATTPHTCVAGSSGRVPTGTCIWDVDIPAELDAQISAGHLPAPDQHTLYMVHFPASVVIQSRDRSAANLADSCVEYCSYHDTYTRAGAGSVYLSIIPDHGANGCQLGCGRGTNFQNTCASASHELGEAVTDAEVGLATTLAKPLGWYDAGSVSQGEIGDMCNQADDSVTSLATGVSYTVQQLFSRSVWNATPVATTAACVSTRFAPSDFAVYLNPTGLAAPSGGSATLPVHLETTAGGSSAVTLALGSATALPAGVHAALSQAQASSGPPGGPPVADLQISVDPGTTVAAGLPVVIEASAAGVVHSALALVQVLAPVPPDFALTVSPQAGPVLPGGSASFTVSATVVAGAAAPVTLAATGLPAGVTPSFSPATITPGGAASSLTLAVAPGAAATAGAATFSVVGTSSSQPGGHQQGAGLTIDGLPAVAVTAPLDGATVKGTVTLAFTATPGANSALTGSGLLLDGRAYAGPLAWDTTAVADGPHTVGATATDADGGRASAQVAVTVANGSTGTVVPPPGQPPPTGQQPPSTSPKGGCSSGGGEVGLLGLCGLGLWALRRGRVSAQRSASARKAWRSRSSSGPTSWPSPG
jgi:hypothetical protein